MQIPELLEISFSHYCDKARWGLEHHRIAFSRRSHLPLLTRLLGRWRAGIWHTVPILLLEDEAIAGSDAILEWADAKSQDPSLSLYPSAQLAETKAWISMFDLKLGPATRRILYYHILDCVPLVHDLFLTDLSAPEKILGKPFLPLLRKAIRKGLKVDQKGVERSRQQLRAACEEVEKALSDGRRYLLGNHFTAADLSFAALSAPLSLPPEYGSPIPSLEQFPPEARAEIEAFRSSVAGQFALRIYREHRHSWGAKAQS